MDSPHTFLLYAREPWSDPALDGRFRWRLTGAPDPLWHAVVADRASRACDVFLSTNSYLTAWMTRVPTVVVVHDMIAFSDEHRPQRRAAAIERATLRPAVRRAKAIIAVSEATKADLAARYPRAADKTHVTHLAADARFSHGAERVDAVRRRHGIAKPYVLSTGTLEPRKNVPRLIEAFAQLPEPLRSRYELVVVGAEGWESEETMASIREHKTFVRALGHVSEEDLPSLYAGADLFCFPSLYEGFGLPVIEAMRSGTAVLTSGVSSLPEIGGEAARYVDPRRVEDIASGIEALLSDPAARQSLANAGLHRAGDFSWTATAERTLRILETQAA